MLFLKRKLFFFLISQLNYTFFFSFKFPLVIKLRMLIHGKNEKGPVDGAGELKVRGDALEGRGAPPGWALISRIVGCCWRFSPDCGFLLGLS